MRHSKEFCLTWCIHRAVYASRRRKDSLQVGCSLLGASLFAKQYMVRLLPRTKEKDDLTCRIMSNKWQAGIAHIPTSEEDDKNTDMTRLA